MGVYSLDGVRPNLPPAARCWIAPDANIVGDVTLGADVSIWFGATLRGDNEPIVVGEGSNVQEACVLHTDMGFPLTIGIHCTIGHRATLHGCTIGACSLIGMGATILNGAVIGAGSVVGACALITEGKIFPPRSLIVGAPGRVVRQLSEEELGPFGDAADHYRDNISRYRNGLRPASDMPSGGNA